jgi:hypothetical protein
MAINANKPHLWKKDIKASVDMFNAWFMQFAPKAYRETRIETANSVERTLHITGDLTAITGEVLRNNSQILPTLRMATCPPLARDRLIGLADMSKNLVDRMEKKNSIPPRMDDSELDTQLGRLTNIVSRMLDEDIFPWVFSGKKPTSKERHRASTIVADRLCGAVSDPIIRNEQEKRQLANIGKYLKKKGYRQKTRPTS